MPLETALHIASLVATNPAGADDLSTADDHIRLLKDVLIRDLPLTTAATALGISVLTAASTSAARTALGAAVSGANTDITSLDGVTLVNVAPILHLNDIVNGDFKIAQIGASFPAAVTGAYDFDGWLNSFVSSTVFTVAQVAGSTSGRLARQVTITTADAAVAVGDYVLDATKIEGSNIEKYVGNTFTIAFRAKVPVAGIHCVALRNSGADRTYVKEINFPTANVWQTCSFTVVGGLPTAGTWNYTNGVGLEFTFTHMCGTTFQTTPDAWQTGSFLGTANQVNDCATVGNVWALEKVTMNLGTVAAVGEISFEAELVRCQRYFRTLGQSMVGIWTASTMCRLAAGLYPPMRAAPSGTLNTTTPAVDDWNAANYTATGATLAAFTATATGIDTYVSGFSGAAGARAPAIGRSDFINLSARL